LLTWRVAVVSALKVLPNNKVAKIFIVCLHYEISFFGNFHRFTNTIGTKKKKPFRASLSQLNFVTNVLKLKPPSASLSLDLMYM